MLPLRRPKHLDAVQLERDGELNHEFRQEVLLGGDNPRNPGERKELVKKMFYETDGNNDGALSLEELEARIVNKTRAHLEEGVIEAKTHIKIVDTNGDGKVSWEEYQPHYIPDDPPKDGHEHKALSDNELPAGSERVSFDRADLDGDGFLNSEEWLRFFHPEHNNDSLMEMAKDILRLYDLDKDGVMKREEFSAVQPSERQDDKISSRRRKAEREAEFNKQIDADGDGVATLEEIFEYINPRNAKSLTAEASQLMDAVDTNGDRLLTLEELLAQDRLVEYSPLLSVAEILHDDL